MQHDKNYRTPVGQWTSPIFDVPDQGEVVVILCDVKIPGKRKPARMKQTAIYEQNKDGREAWHCLQPFALLRWWLRLPAEPTDQIIPMSGEIAP